MTISTRSKIFMAAAAVATATLPVLPQITSGKVDTDMHYTYRYNEDAINPERTTREIIDSLSASIEQESGNTLKLDLSEQQYAWRRARNAESAAEIIRESGIIAHATATVVVGRSALGLAWDGIDELFLGGSYKYGKKSYPVFAIFTDVEQEDLAI